MNIYYVAGVPYTSELYHHGILGQKWGVRRFQNKDGSRTPAGKKRYSKYSDDNGQLTSKGKRRYKKLSKLQLKNEKWEKRRLSNKLKAEKKFYNATRARFFKKSTGALNKLYMKQLREQALYDQTLINGKKIAEKINKEFSGISITELEKYR